MQAEIELTSHQHPWDGSVVLHSVRSGDGVLELVERRRVGENQPIVRKTLSVPLAALDTVVPYFETRLNIAEDEPAGALDDRMTRCLAALVLLGVPRELNEITGLYSVDHVSQVAAWYTELGVAHELAEQIMSDRPIVRTRRRILLRTRPDGPGIARTLWLELSAEFGRSGAIRFHESYKPHDGEPFAHSVIVDDYSALDRLVAAIDAGGPAADLESGLVAALAKQIERGELGDGLPYRRNRDRVRAWCETAGLPYRLDGRMYRYKLFQDLQLPDGDGLSLDIDCNTTGGEATIAISQLYFARRAAPNDERQTITTKVVTPLESLEPLVAYFTPDAVAVTEQRLVACFRSLVERGELGAPLADGRPADANVDRVAEWYAAAGQPYEIRRERDFTLLRTYRKNTDCVFKLSLTLKTRTAYRPGGSPPVQHSVATFHEYYDYLPRAGDAGREYGYTASVAETPADELAQRFENRLGVPAQESDLDARLVACFAELVRRGELADALPLKANRDHVADLITAIGLPVTTDSSHWFNSE